MITCGFGLIAVLRRVRIDRQAIAADGEHCTQATERVVRIRHFGQHRRARVPLWVAFLRPNHRTVC